MTDITRADRGYGRRWLSAHRKGKDTAPITREWLATMRGPSKYVSFAMDLSAGKLWICEQAYVAGDVVHEAKGN